MDKDNKENYWAFPTALSIFGIAFGSLAFYFHEEADPAEKACFQDCETQCIEKMAEIEHLEHVFEVK